LFEQTNDAVFLIGLDGRHLFSNRRAATMLGYDPEELIGMPVQRLTAPSENLEVQRRLQELLAGESLPVYERTMVTRDGREFPVEINAALVRDRDGEPLYIQSVVRDISERQQTDERRRLLVEGVSAVTGEDLFRTLVRHLAAALKVRHAFVAECTTPEPTRARTLAFWSGDRFTRNVEYDVAGTPCEAVLQGEARLYPVGVQKLFPRDRDLTDLDAVGYLGFPLYDSRRREIVGHLVAIDDKPLSRDLQDDWLLRIFASRASAEVERRRIEEQLLQARKMESVSLLAGGIAHDFNNLLMGILGNVSLARTLVSEDDRVARLLREAGRAGERAKRLTQQLLTLAKGGAPIREPLALSTLLLESTELALSGTSVRADYGFAHDLWPADVDAGQVGQVVENLVINAVQAMPEGGVIDISADNVTLSETSDLALAPGRYVRVRVRDNGAGIPPANLGRIFDPYFTTKEDGSGLGLTTSYAIVRKHDGQLGVDSAQGRGSTFTIHLPAHDDQPPARSEPAEEPRHGKRRRVLVMDDEEMVRTVVREMLVNAGYAVSLVNNGEEAIAKYREARNAGAPYHAVILDLTVRDGMGGKETMRHLLELDPQARGIVCSGYSDDPVLSEHESHGFRGRIAKPFVARSLTATLEEILGEAP
jgi:PAS domain S-box-containing protein